MKPEYVRLTQMAILEVDKKFLGQFACCVQNKHPLLAQKLYQVFGILTIMSTQMNEAYNLRVESRVQETQIVDLIDRVVWYAREGLQILEEYVLPMVANYRDLKVLSFKLRASFYYLYTLFHNQPPLNFESKQSTRAWGRPPTYRKIDKGRVVDLSYSHPSYFRGTFSRQNSPNSSFSGGSQPYSEFSRNFIVDYHDYRPITLQYFQEAASLADSTLRANHPLRISIKVGYATYVSECLHDKEGSHQIASATVAETHNKQGPQNDEISSDAAMLVEVLTNMMRHDKHLNDGAKNCNY
ncbi:BgTH12-02105 [Blumeria graminis f. sp. triticale]|uniref:Bgt-5261 n=3 Tax=Blumeria graminis TaxID=34373 RepID=A0A061HJP5_BLUGR|nr:hypothetical protein BGT96224_5261 [Blumeria graminis f. sp. tritici 96224]CAD6501859.1 BgTH12-02105 [Blumeria graminis f. sp. triticale]VDB85754.1 Bgt-5261 [Blumeria graminis f. sp. tritici]